MDTLLEEDYFEKVTSETLAHLGMSHYNDTALYDEIKTYKKSNFYNRFVLIFSSFYNHTPVFMSEVSKLYP